MGESPNSFRTLKTDQNHEIGFKNGNVGDKNGFKRGRKQKMTDAISKNATLLYGYAANKPWLLTQRLFGMVPRVCYMGNTWVWVYPIDTEDELALVDTTVFEGTYLVPESIQELGVNLHNIRNILLTHCHIDHCGGVNRI